MARKNNASKKKQIEQELMESMQSNADFDPIKRQLKINQFEWTEKQKEFFRVALHNDTKIVFVEPFCLYIVLFNYLIGKLFLILCT